MRVFPQPIEFEWDTGNKGKNWRLHKVLDTECEEVFFHPRKRVVNDILHSGVEKRYIVIGYTKNQRALFVVCTIRGKKVRIISARDLNIKERSFLS